jgi:hypothetical protein
MDWLLCNAMNGITWDYFSSHSGVIYVHRRIHSSQTYLRKLFDCSPLMYTQTSIPSAKECRTRAEDLRVMNCFLPVEKHVSSKILFRLGPIYLTADI